MGKGGGYEREVCKLLSLWWTCNQRDDIFWRSSNSGGRATVRATKQKTTKGQYGDIAATDPIGEPLLRVATIEIKRGYNRAVVHNILDRTATRAVQTFEQFIEQASKAAGKAESFSWLLIHRRDMCNAWVYMPLAMFTKLRTKGAFATRPNPCIQFSCKVRQRCKGGIIEEVEQTLFGCALEDMLECVTPWHIREIEAWL